MVKLIDVTVRDGQQSLLATRMKTDDIIPIVEQLDKAGFYALEVWGGATFDAALRYLMEDPWERLVRIRETVRKTKLMMLLRGMNLVGYRHYPRDVVEKFIYYAHKNGIDIFRVFDALNDPSNLEYPIKVINDLGAELQVAMVYSISPVHTLDYYRNLAEDYMTRFEPKTITIKDMSGILTPQTAVELVKELKNLGAEVDIHSHTTAGLAPFTLLKAIEAGADIVDVTVSTMSLYTSHTPAESLITALKNTPYDPQIEMEPLYKAAEQAWKVRIKYRQYDIAGKEPPADYKVIQHQIPGGMLSNLHAQLKQMNAEDKLPQVLQEVTIVRKDLGYPPLVTPLSQIVGTQAVLNILTGRYQALVKELEEYIQGKYGKPPAPINPKLKQLTTQTQTTQEKTPQQTLTLTEAQQKTPGYHPIKPEDTITIALFPETALQTLEKIYTKKLANIPEETNQQYE